MTLTNIGARAVFAAAALLAASAAIAQSVSSSTPFAPFGTAYTFGPYSSGITSTELNLFNKDSARFVNGTYIDGSWLTRNLTPSGTVNAHGDSVSRFDTGSQSSSSSSVGFGDCLIACDVIIGGSYSAAVDAGGLHASAAVSNSLSGAAGTGWQASAHGWAMVGDTISMDDGGLVTISGSIDGWIDAFGLGASSLQLSIDFIDPGSVYYDGELSNRDSLGRFEIDQNANGPGSTTTTGPVFDPQSRSFSYSIELPPGDTYVMASLITKANSSGIGEGYSLFGDTVHLSISSDDDPSLRTTGLLPVAAAVPEPSSTTSMLIGLLCWAAYVRRRSAASN